MCTHQDHYISRKQTISRGLLLLLVLLSGCPQEGTQPGDCSDGADNDSDGVFDCQDDGCAGSPECQSSDEPYIVGGEITRAFAATGALVAFGNQPVCSATLVGADRVLTAAHCVEQVSPGAVQFVIGSLPATPGVATTVSEIAIHPGWTGNVALGGDLAVLRLQTPISNVQPVVLHFGDVNQFISQQMTLVGYGSLADGMSDSGVRRLARVQLASLTNETLVYHFMGMGACKGDSGGPAFVEVNGTWQQVGVTSWAQVPCTGEGHYQRLDVHAGWLASQGLVSEYRTPSCALDDSCDGQCENDEDCWNLMCQSGSCTTLC